MKYPEFDELSVNKPQLQWFVDTGSIPVISKTSTVDTYSRQNSRLVSEYRCSLFKLENKHDMELYCLVKQRICDGWYQLLKENYHWTDSGYPEIWLEWLQQYRELVKHTP